MTTKKPASNSVDDISNAVLIRRLWQVLKPHWHILLISFLGMIFVAALEPIFPAYMQYLLDTGFKDNQLAQWSQWTYASYAVGIVVFFLVRGILVFGTTYTGQWVAHRLVLDLREMSFNKLLNLPKSYFDQHLSSSLISKTTLDIQNVSNATIQVFNVLIRDSLIMIGLLLWLVYLNWKLTCITLVTLPLMIVIVRLLAKRIRQINQSTQQAQEDMAHVLQESIDCERVIKIYGGHGQAKKRFDEINHRIRGMQTRLTVAGAATVPITQFLVSIGVAMVVVVGLWQAQSGILTAGGFMSFITAMLMLLAPLKRIAEINTPLQRGLTAMSSIFKLLEAQEERDTATQVLSQVRGHIRFNKVSLSYQRSNQLVLREIDLDISAGKTVAFVGPSGAGKTSLLNLIPRFYELSSGQILIDGKPIDQLSLSSLRDQIGLVSQDVVLFHDSLAANIAYGQKRKVSMDELRAVAKAAHILEWIDSLPNGFETQVGERGLSLSGGQRQRVAIARAILKNAPILILDEATSALDSVSEKEVQLALESLMKDKTCCVIAHRLSTIINADWIVVMERGQIIEQGTHAQLLAQNGLYAHLFYIQNRQANGLMP